MNEGTTPAYIVLMKKAVMDKLSKGLENTLNVRNFFYSLYDADYVVAEFNDYSITPMSLGEVYLVTGAIAIHDEFTKGIFIDKEDISEVNDIFGWHGGGASLAAEMLSAEERKEIIMKEALLTKPDIEEEDVFIAQKTNKEEELWGSLEEDYELLFEGEDFMYRTCDSNAQDVGKLLYDYGEEIVVYIFDLDKEISGYPENKNKELPHSIPVNDIPSPKELKEIQKEILEETTDAWRRWGEEEYDEIY